MKRALLCRGLLLGLLLGACKGQHGRDEARAPTAAPRAYQEAGESDRPAAASALAKTRCDDPATCADRDACARYAEAMTRAADLSRRIRALAPEDAGGNGVANPQELALFRQGVDDAMKKAEALEPPCREALTRLHAAAR